jgi:prephenate dehydrogenase
MTMLRERLKPSISARVAVVGLGWTGQSFGLALRQALPALMVTGHDRDANARKTAEKAGAVHKTHWNLISATGGAGIVVLALPAHEALATMRALAQELAPGTVVTDTAAVKAPLAAWASNNSLANAYYVGGHPLARRTAEPSASAFAGATYCLTPSPVANPGAVSVVTELVGILGANAMFLDPEEHDGLMAGLQYLPVLAAAINVLILGNSQARTDLRGESYCGFSSDWLREALPAEVITLAEHLGATVGSETMPAGREALVRWLDRYLAALGEVRAALDTGDSDQLKGMLQEAEATVGHWLPQSRSDEGLTIAETRTPGGSWRRLLGMR